MFRSQIIAERHKEIQKSVPILVDVHENILLPYLDKWNDLDDAEKISIDKKVGEIFYSSNPFKFFKENVSSDYCCGVRVAGFIVKGFFIIPICLFEGLINLLLYACNLECDDKDEWLFTENMFHMIEPFGRILGHLLSVIPAIINSLGNAANRPSGEEVYKLIQKLEKMSTTNLEKTIHNIAQEYENANKNEFLDFPSYLFNKDKKSEDLYHKLQGLNLTLDAKKIEIALFMETQSKNAGKELYHIILNELEKGPEFVWPILPSRNLHVGMDFPTCF